MPCAPNRRSGLGARLGKSKHNWEFNSSCLWHIRQWIVGGVGGAPNDRDRDAEFAAQGGVPVDQLRLKLKQTIETAIPIIESQTAESLARQIEVQNYDITTLEAIYHVVEHFGGHAGQIIFCTKMMTGDDLGFYKHLKYSSHREKTP